VDRTVKSALRVFDLLEAFERSRRPMRVAELVEALDVPQSSLSMLLKTLLGVGYIDFDPETREYCPSVRVANLCEWATHLPSRPKALQETLEKLSAQTNETVLLGRIDGAEVQYAAVIHSRRTVRFVAVSGARRPLHRTALGICLLTTLSDERIALLLRRYNAEREDHVMPAQLDAVLNEVALARAQGYYFSAGLVTPGAGVIGTVLPTPVRGQKYAVGIGGPIGRLRRRQTELVAQLRTCAALC
jgi:DNA-binding IclR family transcriptional regulator